MQDQNLKRGYFKIFKTILKGKIMVEKKKIWAIRHIEEGKEYWATGEFDRCDPPGSYLGKWEDACVFTDFEYAKHFQGEFGGEIVEFSCVETPEELDNGEKHDIVQEEL